MGFSLDNYDEKIEFAKHILEHNSSLINLADTKAGILLGINGIILALLFNIENGNTLALIHLFLIPTGIILGISSIFAILTIIPRFTQSNIHTMIYFLPVAKLNKEEYIESWNNLKSPNILRDLLSNIHSLALLQTKKYKYLKISVILLLVGLSLLVANLVVYYLVIMKCN
jgi:hypothetical protein